MSEGSISQEEIDALLSGVDVGGLNSSGSFSSIPDIAIDITTLQNFANDMKDKLSDIIKQMTQKDCSSEAPSVESAGRDQLIAKMEEEAVAVYADYSAGLAGDHIFYMSKGFATKLIEFINSEENPELSEMGLSIVTEVVSAFSGAENTALSATGKLPGLATTTPTSNCAAVPMLRVPQGNFALFTYKVNLDGTSYELWEAVSGGVADGMAKALGGGSQPAMSSSMGTLDSAGFTQSPMSGAMGMGGMGMQQQSPMGAMGMGMPMGGMGMQQQMPMGAMGMPMGGMGMQQQMPMGGMGMINTPNVQSLQFQNFPPVMSNAEQANINLIMDVFMEMTVELGRTKKTIKEILGLGEGTIIELDKLAGEPVDILVNHKPIAKGEVVVIDENFGVRVTEILPAIEHLGSSGM